MIMENKIYKLCDAAELLGIKVRTAREWIKDGRLLAKKYPGCNRWFVEEEEIIRVRSKLNARI